MLVPLALSILLHRSDDRTTATVTLAQVLSNYCPPDALRQWHDTAPSNNG